MAGKDASRTKAVACAEAVCIFQEWIDCGCLTGNSSDFATAMVAVQLTFEAQWLSRIPPV